MSFQMENYFCFEKATNTVQTIEDVLPLLQGLSGIHDSGLQSFYKILLSEIKYKIKTDYM